MYLVLLTILMFFTLVDGMENSLPENNIHLIDKVFHNILLKDIILFYTHKVIRTTSSEPTYKNHRNNWSYISQHDGTYYITPDIGYKYSTWEAYPSYQLMQYFNDEQQYDIQLISTPNKKTSYKFAMINTHDPKKQNKNFLLINNDNVRHLKSEKNILHHLFNYNGTLLMCSFLENKDNDSFNIYDINKKKDIGYEINGFINALCAGHRSSIFAIGSNQPATDDFSNLILYKPEKEPIQLDGENSPITSLEFSQNDKQLLVSSYHQENNRSKIALYDISIINDIKTVFFFYYGEYHISKVFFICNGEKIIVLRKDGAFGLLDPITGSIINISLKKMLPTQKPFIIASSKHQLIISALNKNIEVFSAKTTKLLKTITTAKIIRGIGLTDDEKIIVFIDNHKNVYELPLYSIENNKMIKLIENIDFFNLYKIYMLKESNIHSFKKTTIIYAIESYILQQKIQKLKEKLHQQTIQS